MKTSFAGRALGAAPAVFVGLLFTVSALAQTADPAAPGAPATAPSGSAPDQPPPPPPSPAASATTATTATERPATATEQPATAPATAPVQQQPVYPQPVYPQQPYYPPQPHYGAPYGDAGRKEEPRSPATGYVGAGGVLSQGLDTTNSATRQGGFYLGGGYLVQKIVPIDAHYSFASGHVMERLPGSRFGTFGAPNDVEQLQSRHAFDVTAGYLWRITEGHERVYAVPYLGPRALFLVDKVSPLWAMEAELGARVGLWSGDEIAAEAFLSFDPAFARTSDPGTVYGKIQSELRFGAGFTLHPTGGALGARLAYEGDVVSLENEKLTFHQLLAGLVYSFE